MQTNAFVEERRGLLLPGCCHVSENREAQSGRVVVSPFFFSPVIYRWVLQSVRRNLYAEMTVLLSLLLRIEDLLNQQFKIT